jgi:hypothetical protein
VKRWLAVAGVFVAGVLAGAQWVDPPFGVSEEDVADRPVDFREQRGFSPLRASCHERSNGPRGTGWSCEVTEATDEGIGAEGYEEYIVRRHNDRWQFDRLKLH